MKKAFKWLEHKGLPFDFHDYKKDGVDAQMLRKAINHFGWDTVINKRGTTWRQLPDELKNNMDEAIALEAALSNPSLIKRPLIVQDENMLIAFDEEQYEDLLT